jgi:hypothetical protein
VPRHPPCALTNLATKYLMLASTVQFSRYGRESILARRVPAGQQAVRRRICPTPPRGAVRSREHGRRVGSPKVRQRSPGPSGPNSVPKQTIRVPVPFLLHECSCTGRRGRGGLPTGQCSTLEHHPRSVRPGHGSGRATRRSLARCSLERR